MLCNRSADGSVGFALQYICVLHVLLFIVMFKYDHSFTECAAIQCCVQSLNHAKLCSYMQHSGWVSHLYGLKEVSVDLICCAFIFCLPLSSFIALNKSLHLNVL